MADPIPQRRIGHVEVDREALEHIARALEGARAAGTWVALASRAASGGSGADARSGEPQDVARGDAGGDRHSRARPDATRTPRSRSPSVIALRRVARSGRLARDPAKRRGAPECKARDGHRAPPLAVEDLQSLPRGASTVSFERDVCSTGELELRRLMRRRDSAEPRRMLPRPKPPAVDA